MKHFYKKCSELVQELQRRDFLADLRLLGCALNSIIFELVKIFNFWFFRGEKNLLESEEIGVWRA